MGIIVQRLVWIGCIVALATHSSGQQPTTVQLPTISTFSVQTTVTVPDRGGAYLGGVSRSASHATQWGTPFLHGIGPTSRLSGNPTLASRGVTGGLHLRATIHDLQAMDQAILSQATRPSSSNSRSSPRFPHDRGFYPHPRPTFAAERLADSVSAIRDAQDGVLRARPR